MFYYRLTSDNKKTKRPWGLFRTHGLRINGSQKPPMVLFETGQPNPAPSSPADVHSGIFCYNLSQLTTNSFAFAEATSEHRKNFSTPPIPLKIMLHIKQTTLLDRSQRLSIETAFNVVKKNVHAIMQGQSS